jgi:hypothetical protein
MAGEKLSVDELLANQGKQGALRATIEAISDDTERVKVTPFIAGLGCLCDQALNIKKDQIESISTTDDVHICCGKRLLVVEISFKDSTVADLFQQLSDPARLGAIPGSRMPASGNQLPFMPPNLMSRSRRGSEAFLRRPMPVSNLASAGYQPNQVLSYERAAGGIWSSIVNGLISSYCENFRSNCHTRCHELQTIFGLDDAAFFTCYGLCDEEYSRCVG